MATRRGEGEVQPDEGGFGKAEEISAFSNNF